MSDNTIKIGKKVFLFSAGIILALMVFSGLLTRILPAGSYDRLTTAERTVIVDGSYREIPRPEYPVWRWFTAPFEVLIGMDNITPVVLMIFIMAVGGAVTILDQAGIMKALINFLASRFAKRKYLLLSLLIIFFMGLSCFVGMFEEMVPLVIFVIPLAISLGWDSLTGLGMSLLPMAFGFATAVTNPYTVGIAQKIAGLPLFSGALLRLALYVTLVCLLILYVMRHAKRIEKNPECSICFGEDELLRKKMKAGEGALKESAAKGLPGGGTGESTGITRSQWKALIWFVSCVAAAMTFVVSTGRIPVLSDLAFPVLMLMYLTGGIGAGIFSGLKAAGIIKTLAKGMLNILPGAALIIMAYSVKYIMSRGMIMDTLLFRAAELIRESTPMSAAFLVYATTLVINFFIASASAKAFLMMPLLVPLADLAGITRQTAVLGFAFGDGFTNVVYPTSPLLLIALSFTVVSYAKWMRWTWKLHIVILIVTSAFLAFAVKIGFGPF